MDSLRWVALAGILLSVTLATPQTAAFSSVSADRSVTVAVADDDDAFLGVERSPVSVPQNGTERTPLLTVTNRFPMPVSMQWNVTDERPHARPTIQNVSGPDTLDSGTTGTLQAVVVCGNSTSVERPTIRVRATSEAVSVEIARSVEVRCV